MRTASYRRLSPIMTPRKIPYLSFLSHSFLLVSKVNALSIRLTNIICDRRIFRILVRGRRIQLTISMATAAPILTDELGNGEQFREESAEFNAYLSASA